MGAFFFELKTDGNIDTTLRAQCAPVVEEHISAVRPVRDRVYAVNCKRAVSADVHAGRELERPGVRYRRRKRKLPEFDAYRVCRSAGRMVRDVPESNYRS